MSWYNQSKLAIKLAKLRGEWWIIDGNASFADGDIGDYNHEAVAIEYAQSQVKNAMITDPIFSEVASVIFGEQGDYKSFDPIGSRVYLNDWADAINKDSKITDEKVDDIYDTIVKRTRIDRDLLDIAMGNMEDVRDYAKTIYLS